MDWCDRFAEALVYVTHLHAQQRRKLSGAPYVSHLLRVAGIALEYGADPDEAIAALLHDAVEDQGGAARREEIGRRFGARVMEIVDGSTDTDQTPKPPWRERKEAFLARLPEASASVRLVVAADKLDNVRSTMASYHQHGPAIWEHFKGGRDGLLWYFRRVVEILTPLGPPALVDELRRAVEELSRIVEDTAE
jgi:(p)ppGpp synthase/HD superfamily hydrolase